jgi:hypothetical protein
VERRWELVEFNVVENKFDEKPNWEWGGKQEGNGRLYTRDVRI